MRFAPDEDETMVEDMLDRALRDAAANAPRIDGAAPMPDPEALRATLGRLGVLGAWLPEAAGGGGAGPRYLMTLARGVGHYPSQTGYLGSAVLGGALLARSGEAGADLAARVAAGEATVAVATLEPGRRWSLSPKTVLATEGRITGRKVHVAEAEGAEAILVIAREAEGTALYLVQAGAPGLTVESYQAFDFTTMSTVTFHEAEATRLLAPGAAEEAIEEAYTLARFAMASEILGACETALADTLDYLRTREQFGKPLAANQALRFRAADLHADIELLRSQVLGAAATLDLGMSLRARADVSAAAALACETGDLAGREAIHLHGAIGMTREFGIGRHLLRINALTCLLGDARHHRDAFLDAEIAA